jgi:hypothetical protein
MKILVLVIALMAALHGFGAPVVGMTCKANYPVNEQADIFPDGYFSAFAEAHPIK